MKASINSDALITALSDGSTTLLDLNAPETPLSRWQIGKESLACMTTLGNHQNPELVNCFLGISQDGWMKMIDFRCKQFIWKERINPLKGVPSALSLGQDPNRVMVGTQRGFIDLFDIRKRLYVESYLLKRGDECLPVYDLKGFIPTSSFRNMKYGNKLTKKNKDLIEEGRRNYYLITYPSHFSEFSVFPMHNNAGNNNSNINPLLHFQAENQTFSNFYMRSKELPYLKRLEPTDLIDVHYKLNTEGLMLSKRLLNMQNLLEKDKALYTDILKGNLEFLVSASKLSLMQEHLSTSGVFEKQTEYFHSLTSNVVVPSQWQSINEEFFFDNVIITAGQDRNIRFINLGNEFKYKAPMSEEFKRLKCYLLSSSDFRRRSYFYHYSGDICMIRESFHLPKADSTNYTEFDGFSQAFGITNLENEVFQSGLSQSHLYNFGKGN
jgi:hypothetical protein